MPRYAEIAATPSITLSTARGQMAPIRTLERSPLVASSRSATAPIPPPTPATVARGRAPDCVFQTTNRKCESATSITAATATLQAPLAPETICTARHANGSANARGARLSGVGSERASTPEATRRREAGSSRNDDAPRVGTSWKMNRMPISAPSAGKKPSSTSPTASVSGAATPTRSGHTKPMMSAEKIA